MRAGLIRAALLLGVALLTAAGAPPVAVAAAPPAPPPGATPGAPQAAPPMVIGPPPDPASIPTSVLPEGKGREVVIQQCGLCHPIDLVVQQRRTQDEWDTLISRMADHGARASEAEQQVIFEYLVLHFGKEPVPPPPAP